MNTSPVSHAVCNFAAAPCRYPLVATFPEKLQKPQSQNLRYRISVEREAVKADPRPGNTNSLTDNISQNRESASTAPAPKENRKQANHGSLLMTQMKKKTPDLASFSLVNHPFFLFNHVFLYRGRELSRALAKYDLDYPRWRVLSVLNEYPNCTMQVLADTVGVDRTSLTHTVRLMIDAGLLSKTSRRSDRRSVALALTDEGSEKFKKVLPIIMDNNNKCFSDFSDEETKKFINFLRRIVANIQKDSEIKLDEFDNTQNDIIKSIISSE